jgi:hypothetical protein
MYYNLGWHYFPSCRVANDGKLSYSSGTCRFGTKVLATVFSATNSTTDVIVRVAAMWVRNEHFSLSCRQLRHLFSDNKNDYDYRAKYLQDLVTPNISAGRKIDNTLLIKALFISRKRSN